MRGEVLKCLEIGFGAVFLYQRKGACAQRATPRSATVELEADDATISLRNADSILISILVGAPWCFRIWWCVAGSITGLIPLEILDFIDLGLIFGFLHNFYNGLGDMKGQEWCKCFKRAVMANSKQKQTTCGLRYPMMTKLTRVFGVHGEHSMNSLSTLFILGDSWVMLSLTEAVSVGIEEADRFFTGRGAESEDNKIFSIMWMWENTKMSIASQQTF